MWLSVSMREGRRRAESRAGLGSNGAQRVRELKIEEWIRWDSLGFCYFGQTVHFAPFFFWILAWISRFGTGMVCFGRYGPIQHKLVRFSASRPKLARISAYREPEKKKKEKDTALTHRQRRCPLHPESDAGSAAILPRRCIIGVDSDEISFI